MMQILTLPTSKKEIVFGQTYRLRKDGDVIKAYLMPTIDPNATYRTIPDNAAVTVLGETTKNGDVWLKVNYQAFTGSYYVQADLIDDIQATVEVQKVVIPAPPETKPLTPTIEVETVHIPSSVKTYDEQFLELLEALHDNLGKLIALHKSKSVSKETAHV